IGGHSHFITAKMSVANTTICTMSVRLMFTVSSLPACQLRSAQCAACNALTNGFANVKKSAKPMPIIATASKRPATRNICTRSTGSSSGWRAEPSMKRPPRMPKPMAVPSAPMPKMMPTASTVMAWMCAMFSIQLSSKNPIAETSMMLGGHRQVDDRQHHENERLQRDDQHVKARPDQAEDQLADHSCDRAEGAAECAEAVEPARQRQRRQQQEDHLAGVQVAVETQRQ